MNQKKVIYLKAKKLMKFNLNDFATHRGSTKKKTKKTKIKKLKKVIKKNLVVLTPSSTKKT